MRIIDRDIVESIPWTDAATYDQQLSQLSIDGQPFMVINPELPYSALDLINTNIIATAACIKYKVGEGWIAKQFPGQWNGCTQIVQVPAVPCSIIKDKYATGQFSYNPDAWDLKYDHIYIYDRSLTGGAEVDAVTLKYIEKTIGRKIIGTAAASVNNEFEIVFLSNNEPNADTNYAHLLTRFPNAKRVNGVKGILNAHRAAAELAASEMFWVVDADAYIVDNFNFEFSPYIQDRNIVHIWHSLNPVNGLEYGYGGVKLFPREPLLKQIVMPIDVSTSLGRTRVIKEVACETRFNTDPFNAWKSAFRECVKLSSKVIVNQISKETEDRLATWCTMNNDAKFGFYSYLGALAGKEFGEDKSNDLSIINDYAWLQEKFQSTNTQLNISL
jgi:hypothetical protein